MAQKNNKGATAPSTQELNKKITYEEKNKYNFAQAQAALNKLVDLTKTRTKSIATFKKETLRTYLQNLGSNEKNLRNLSWYLLYRSQTYMRMVNFNADMFCLDVRSVIPPYELTKENNPKKILKSYNDTLNELERMNLQHEFTTAYKTCFIQDVFYGIYIADDTGVFVFPIPADYAKLEGKYSTGDYSFAVDMTYFNSRQELLEAMPNPLDTMYREYKSTGNKWISVPDENCMCLKFRTEDFETILPPFVACFNALINLSDLEDIQAIADEQEIYKMIWLELETLSNSNQVDDWKVDPDLMVEYFNKMQEEAIPDYTTAAIVPGKLQTISFDTDKSTDTSKISKATESVLNTAGGSEILNGSTISGAEAFRSAQIANTEFAISSLLPQTQAIVNRLLSYRVSNPCRVKFFPVSAFTKKQFKDDMLKGAEYVLPTKLVYNACNGFSELDTLSLNYLEEDILNLGDRFVPVQSTHTQSGNDSAGRPKDDSQTTDGEESEEKRDKSKG